MTGDTFMNKSPEMIKNQHFGFTKNSIIMNNGEGKGFYFGNSEPKKKDENNVNELFFKTYYNSMLPISAVLVNSKF